MATFKQAIKKMMEVGEFERLIKHTKGKEKQAVKEFYELIYENEDFERIPGITLLCAVHSYSILQDAITFMEIDMAEEQQAKKSN